MSVRKKPSSSEIQKAESLYKKSVKKKPDRERFIRAWSFKKEF